MDWAGKYHDALQNHVCHFLVGVEVAAESPAQYCRCQDSKQLYSSRFTDCLQISACIYIYIYIYIYDTFPCQVCNYSHMWYHVSNAYRRQVPKSEGMGSFGIKWFRWKACLIRYDFS
jgi:hypothetical protein